MQASGKTIGILSAVVLGGLGLWYMTKDDDETVADTTTTPMVTPSGGGSADADAIACSDALGCPADKPYCVSGECSDEFPAEEHFTKYSGSPYPKFGRSQMWRGTSDQTKTIPNSEPRAQYEGLSAAAAACNADPNCIGFSWWPERYDNYNPKDAQECSADSECLGLDRDGTMKTKGRCYPSDDGKSYCRHPAWNLSYFYSNAEAPGNIPADWDGDTWHDDRGALTFSQSIGPSDEYLSSRRPRADNKFDYAGDGTDERYVYEGHLKQVGYTYIKKGYEDYKPSDSWNNDRTAKTSTSAAEDETPAYLPSTAPSGSGYIIADPSTTTNTSW
ncbi:MAG TPA: hypothetical protein DHN29_05310 [Cytophagales bacterium]|nr:hypothetical protein [Cytophagales bacterium]